MFPHPPSFFCSLSLYASPSLFLPLPPAMPLASPCSSFQIAMSCSTPLPHLGPRPKLPTREGAIAMPAFAPEVSSFGRKAAGVSALRASSGAAEIVAPHPIFDSVLTATEPQKYRQVVVKPASPPVVDGLRHGGLDPSGVSFKERFLVRCYEVGMNSTASPETMANLLQEVACNHAQSVGFSTDGFATTTAMRKKRLIWVTARMHIEVVDYPAWGDALEMETWCQCEGKAGTRRDWTISNLGTGRMVGRATSTWVMMNQDTRRISRVTEDVLNELLQYYPTEPRYAFPEENSSSLKKIPKLQDPAQHIRSGLMPRRGDLDMNQHVNNVAYIGWVLESIPQHIFDTHQLHRITLDYRRECSYDDVVESLASLELDNDSGASDCIITSNDDLVFLHIVRLAGSHTEINRARTVWKAKCKKAFN